jgi:2'-5' RNA ligase
MKLPSVHGYVIWLLLSDSDRDKVRSWQNELQGYFASPDFEPHLTLLRPSEQKNEGRVTDILETFSSVRKNLTLKITGADGKDSPYQCFYLNVLLSGSLNLFRQELAKSLNSETGSSFNPHISLLYGFMSDSERERLKSHFALKEKITLTGDALALVKCNGTPEDWKIVKSINLTS